MKVLFISKELIAGDLAYRLKQEGCDVKLFIQDENEKECFDGMVEKTNNWESELTWVGKDGLIIFDDVGYGNIQDKLRKDGYLVIGGSGDGDRLELDRIYGQKILKSTGVLSDGFETKRFTIQSAIAFVKKHKGTWVAKQNDHNTALNYVGKVEDGSDMVSVLENYKNILGSSCSISLQKKANGVEIAIGRFFNGKKWLGPSVINFEHKHLCNDDIGPLGGETGTLMWYEKNDSNKLFQKTLAKLETHLKKSRYVGYVDINCIVNRNEIYPLEITSRFGSSTIETQDEIQISPWKEFLLALAKGENYDLKYKKKYAVNVALTIPPFPYKTSDKNILNSGINIFFATNLSKEDFAHIHYEGVLIDKKKYYTAGNSGYVVYITGTGSSVQQAREKVYNIIDRIIIPKMFYRTDIGLRFIRKDQKLLKKWGWI